MVDLKTKQEFWSEQLPIFKEKYWIPDHLEVLEFDMNDGCFDITEGVKTDLSEEDLYDIYHRVNSGWAMWKKAVTFMKDQAQAVPDTHMVLPKVADKQMINAGYEAHDGFYTNGQVQDVYQAMVKASESGAKR
ncbi:hypothetical protein [Acinetobacter nosocomialis]|uniref:hypothetical protein n=1 Tax=Acinetobacter nosocomialis TaxID=106654 RepID=UPI000A563812|nr:hypothetical protein [Acinetobacter nosocomialis]